MEANKGIDAVDKFGQKVRNSILLIEERNNDFVVFFKGTKRFLKDYLQLFEKDIKEHAPKIGIQVRLHDADIPPEKGTKLKLCQNFKVFLIFYGLYLEPYSIGKEMICFFCSECGCVVFAWKTYADKQTHLKGKLIDLSFLKPFYTNKRIDQDQLHQGGLECLQEQVHPDNPRH